MNLLLTGGEARPPFVPASRFWRGQMCGIHLPGLPPVPGGAADPTLFLSWFYDRYGAADRRRARQQMHAQGYTHWVVSWPDAEAVGRSPQAFAEYCDELTADGFAVCPFLSAKPTSSADIRTVPETLANIEAVLPWLVGRVPMLCLGWELSLWLSPVDVQWLIDQVAPQVLTQPGTRFYIHLQQGYSSYQRAGEFFADFWNRNVHKLTGVLHQKELAQTLDQYRYDSGGLVDALVRFAGNYGVAPDSGFGHPFDLVAWEITAQDQFNGDRSEIAGDFYGQWAEDTPMQAGPAGWVRVMGSGNGS